MLNFTVGPVMTWDEILNIGSQQVPYFRTPEFSELMKESERMMLEFSNAPEGSRSVFLTGSGTMAMEVSVHQFLSNDDHVLVINGGSFGQRFVDLCQLYGVSFDEIKLNIGEPLTSDMLNSYNNRSYTALLVNMHETSTGILYNINMIKDFCKKNNIMLIVDAISAFLADPLDMAKMGIDVMITSSQKALACAPGVSIITMAPKVIERIEKGGRAGKGMYFDLAVALRNADRGQTPFTPAVGTLLQINKRLHMVEEAGGPEREVERVTELAAYFREKIKDMPFEAVSKSPSNAVTCLHPTGMSARTIVDCLKDEYDIWVCPNGGEHADYMFRVGHIGNISHKDIDTLVEGLENLTHK